MNSCLTQMPRMLDDRLRLRFAEPADAEVLAEFQQRIHQGNSEHFDYNLVGKWIECLMSGNHPTFRPGDFTLVEEVETGKVVSSMNLISQTWAYGGIPFPVGRPELVATDPEYRRRGLIRHQFEVLHALSESRGEMLQAITGIPWFYRQFGYEMAMDLETGRSIPVADLPDAPKEDPYRLRPAQTDDIPFMRELYEQGVIRDPFAVVWTQEDWNYELKIGRAKGNNGRQYAIIEASGGERIGFLRHGAWQDWQWFYVNPLEIVRRLSYLNVMPKLLHALWEYVQTEFPCEPIPATKLKGLCFVLGREHPAYAPLHRNMWRSEGPYGWYIRISDLPAFLRHIRPALERNLLGTPAEGYTGEFKINFYKKGIRLNLERGCLTDIKEATFDWGHARFPELTFLQLVCGRRRCEELAQAHVDCQVNREAQVVLDAMFPPFKGELMPIC